MNALVSFLLLVSFFSNLNGMVGKGPQGLADLPIMTCEELNKRLYSLSTAQMTEYEQARVELLKNPTSVVARNRLKIFVDNGYVPALYPLAGAELHENNLEKAAELVAKGARVGDSRCALTLATLYNQEQFDNGNWDERNQTVQNWLRIASANRFIYEPNSQKPVAQYRDTQARDNLRVLLDEYQKAHETVFANYCPEQLKKAEKDLDHEMHRELACFLIKEKCKKGTHDPLKQALGLAERLVESDSCFDPDYLHASGVRDVLEKLKSHPKEAIQKRVKALLDRWDQEEICRGKRVEVCQKKIQERFVAPRYSPEALQLLIDDSSTRFEGVDCVDAALYVNMHRLKNEQASKAVRNYLDRALKDPNPTTKRALIERCQLDLENLAPWYVKALDVYAAELKSKEGLLQEEADFMNTQLQRIQKKADAGDDEAALQAYHLVHNYASCFTVTIGKEQEFETKYFKKAYDAGNYTAVVCTLPSARNKMLNLNTNADICSAMKIWTKIHQVIREEAVIKEAYENIIKLREAKKVLGTTVEDAEFYYHLAQFLAHTSCQESMSALGKAMKVVFAREEVSTGKYILYETTGTKALLEKLAQEGKGWAYFAQAFYTFTSAIHPSVAMQADEYCIRAITEMEKARNLLKKAGQAATPYLNYALLDDATIDAYVGTHHYNLYRVRGSREEYIREKALEYLKASADQLNAKGMLEWAAITLNGDGQKGQTTFEQCVSCLLRSAGLKNSEAMEYLEKMASEGLLYYSKCGGTMTADLLERMNLCLMEFRKRAGVVPEVALSTSTLSPEEEYARARKEADEGNIESMVKVGALLRDGMGVSQSIEAAADCFVRAIFAWNGDPCLQKVISVASKELTFCTSNNNVRAAIAHAKILYANQELMRSLEVISNNQQHTSQMCKKDDGIIGYLERAQQLMLESSDMQDRDLFYTSGLAESIARGCSAKTKGTFLLKVARLYMHRMKICSQEIMCAEQRELLLKPFFDLQERFILALRYEDFERSGKDSIQQELNLFIKELQSLIAGNVCYKTYFEYLAVLCDVYIEQ